MKRLLLIVLVIGIFVPCKARKNKVHKPWTVIIYMAAANNLQNLFMSQLKEISALQESPFVNVLVYVTNQNSDGHKQTKKLCLSKNGLHLEGPVLHRDSGHVASFAEALQWAVLDYPSDHLAVILAGHASGPLNIDHQSLVKGICYDFHSGNYLTDKDCYDALEWTHGKLMNGKKIDIVACDASFFGSVEIAYTFAPFVDYLVAPEGMVSVKRLPYGQFLSAMSRSYYDPQSCAQSLVEAYDKRLQKDEMPLSVIDLSYMDTLVENMNSLAQIFYSHLQGKHGAKTKSIIKKCINKNTCPTFCNNWYIDLMMLYRNLLKNSEVFKLSQAINNQTRKLLLTGAQIIKKMVYRGPERDLQVESTTNQQPILGGLAVYFPRNSIQPSYYGLYWISHNKTWLNFLEAFIE
jgi:hypothetical protein